MIKDKETYEYLFIDAQLFLTRNWMVLKNKPYYSEQSLFKSFFQSIVKLVKEEVNTKNVVLLWDKSPYHKIAMLEDYKGDRDYRGESDITDDMSEEEKELLRKNTEQFRSRQSVKYKLVFESAKFGMPSVILGGYEADDFAYLASTSDLVKNAPGKSCICSKDGDQIFMVNDKMDFYRITKNREHHTMDTLKSVVGDMNPYRYVSIDQSLHGSHNFLKSTRHPEFIGGVDFVSELLETKSFSFTNNPDLFQKQLDSFKVWNYPNYEKAKWMINNIPLKAEFMDESQFNQYCLNNHLDIKYNYYKSFKEQLGK
jgi:hypothetical protein